MRVLTRGVMAGLLAVLISAMFLLPFIDALVQSDDYIGRMRDYSQWDRSASWSQTAGRLWTNVIPFVYGWPESVEPRLPAEHYTPLASYAGSVVFPFALIGLFNAQRLNRLALGVFLAFGFLAGASAPGVADVLGRLPLFSIAINERLIFAATFGLAAAAGVGVDAMREKRARAAGIALTIAVVLFLLVASRWEFMQSIGLQPSFVRRNSLWLIAPLFGVAGLLAVPPLRRAVPALLIGLLLVQRSAEVGGVYPVVSADAFFPKLPLLEKLEADRRLGRVAGTGTILPPNTSTHYRLEDPRGFTGMTFARLAQTFPLWTVPQPIFFNRIDDLYRPFLDFLNVRYALISVFTSVPEGWRTVARSQSIVVIENEEVMPRAFVPDRVWLNLPAQSVLGDMSANHDFARLAWINVPGAARLVRRKESTASENGPGVLVVRRSGSGYAIDATMEKAGWVVLSETAWRGWKLFVNGESVPVAYANHAFIGFHLPRGRHSVLLRYWPDSFRLGLALSGLTLFGAGFFGFTRRSIGTRKETLKDTQHRTIP